MATRTKVQTQDLRADHPNTWIPADEGDELRGVVVEVTRAWSDTRNRGRGDGWYPLLQVKTSDGMRAFHAFTEVSYNRVVEMQPLPGEKIVVTFTGLGKAKEGQNAPKLFTIELPERDPKETARSVYAAFKDSPRALPVHDSASGGSDNDIPF